MDTATHFKATKVRGAMYVLADQYVNEKRNDVAATLRNAAGDLSLQSLARLFDALNGKPA